MKFDWSWEWVSVSNMVMTLNKLHKFKCALIWYWFRVADGRAQFPHATSSSRRGASGRRNPPINLRPCPYPLDEGKAINSQIMTRRYIAAISLLTIGETKILSLTPCGGVTDTTLKPPLKHLQWLGKKKKNKCIYTSTLGPTKVRNSNPETLIFLH